MALLFLGLYLFIIINIGLVYLYKRAPKKVIPIVLIVLTILNIGSHVLVEYNFTEKYKDNHIHNREEIEDFYELEGHPCGGYNTYLVTDNEYISIEEGILNMAPFIVSLIIGLMFLLMFYLNVRNTEKLISYYITCFISMIPVSLCILLQCYGLICFKQIQFFIEFGISGF